MFIRKQKAPILDIFYDEALISRDNICGHHKEEYKAYGIDTVLYIFYKTEPEFLKEYPIIYEYKNGSNVNKVYLYKNKFAVALSPLGGPAAAGLMEELGYLGLVNQFAVGSSGQINHNFPSHKLLLVQKAIRDEGTSYKYIKPSTYAYSSEYLTNIIANYLTKQGLEFEKSTTWTTDSFFRETQKTVNKRVKQGAVAVEMESASWCAVAKYRNYNFAQLLYFSDAVKQEGWNLHAHRKSLRDNLIFLMLDCVEEFVDSKNE